MNNTIRQIHRWLGVVFTVAVIVNVVVLGLGQTAEWVYYLPLPPLGLLWLTGAYLFLLPYGGRRMAE